jgi:hypothetical protein
MILRFARAALVGLLLLQSGLFAPAAMALDASQAADCAEHMGTRDSDCPCCPHSASTSTGCMTICLGVFAGMSNLPAVVSYGAGNPAPDLPPSFLVSQTYTPVNPPPIG